MADEVVATPVEEQGAPAPEGQAEPYFSYDYPDGEKVSYATKEELAAGYKDSYFRTKDYTRKSQENARYRKQYEDRMKELDDREKSHKEREREWEQRDKFIKSRPDVYKQIGQLMQRPASPEEFVNEKYSALEKEIEDMKSWRKEQELNRETDALFSQMQGKYEDFDPDMVREQINLLSESGLDSLVETIYYANKGRVSPAQMQQKVAENLAKKKKAAVMPGKGAPVPIPEDVPDSIDAARDRALKDAGG